MKSTVIRNVRLARELKTLLLAMLVCIASLSAGYSVADDTEVFFGSAASTGETRPNVLLVLDTSGSMGARDGLPLSRLDRMKDAVRRMLESQIDMNIGLMQFSGVYGGGSVSYPVTPLDEIVCTGADCKTPTLADNVYRVDNALGDVEQRVSDGDVTTDGDILNLGYQASNASKVGLRYPDINISRGATILEARLEFVAVSQHTDSASLIVKIEDTGHSEPFDANDNTVSDRTFEANGVGWEADEWYPDTTYESPDVSELVQGVINRDDWCTGGAMTFSVERAAIESTGTRHAYSYEKATANGVDYMPRLTIVQDPDTVVAEENCGGGSQTLTRQIMQSTDDVEQYLQGTDGGFDTGSINFGGIELDVPSNNGRFQTTAVRFQDITVPKDATIESATIEFTTYSYKSGDLSLEIYGETGSNPPTYSTSDSPRRRTLRSNPVIWNNLPVASTNVKVTTPNLNVIVEDIVSASDWVSGNAISFQLGWKVGSGRRGFSSYDASPGSAPKLIITYNTGTDSGTGDGSGPSGPYVSTPSVPTTYTSKAREEMLDIVDGLVATGGTPGVDSYYEAALYMRGEAVDYGKTRGATSNPWKRERFRVSHADSYTGGTLKRDVNCTDVNLSSSACRSEQIVGNPIYTSPIAGSCQANHIVLLSDGDTDRNSVTPKILNMIGEDACTESGDEACATDLAAWLNSTDHSSAFADTQNIKTHTIAFNLEGSGKDFMRRIAIAGGGSAYEADTSDELLNVFNDIAANVADVDTGFTSPSATVNQFNRLTHRDDVYLSLFKPSATHAWDGNIKRFRVGKDNSGNGDVVIRDLNGDPAIDENTGFFAESSQSFWPERDDAGVALAKPDGSAVARGGAANQIKLTGLAGGIGDRRVYTWLGDAGSSISDPIDLMASDQEVHEDNTLLTDSVLGITGAEVDADDQEAYRESLIQWARGVDVFDHDEDGDTADARRQMGDPMHSRPVIVNYATGSSSADVRSLVFVGTNQGFLHAIDTESGEEQYSFIPSELLGNLQVFYANESGFARPYGLDGALSVWREDPNDNLVVDSGESAYLFVGMRRGGSGYYALDITDPDHPKLAWTIKGGDGGTSGFATMGQSWSRLTPVKMFIDGSAQDVLVFGGGYDENQDRGSSNDPASHTTDTKGAGIYIVKARTGELLWSGLGTLGGSKMFDNMDYGFNSHVRAIDIDRDGLVDQMYAADGGGQLWRFDMTQYHDSNSGDLVHGGVIADFSAGASSAHRRFYNEPDVALIESEGERFLSISIGSGWRAHPLDETTQDRFYMLRQYAVYEKPEGYGKQSNTTFSPFEDSDLVNVSSTANPDTNAYGWYLDFTTAGEKVLGTSVTFDGKVIFSTYVPTVQNAVCSPEVGSGRAYIMDVASGAPAVDLDDSEDSDSDEASDLLTLSDRSTDLRRGGIPSEALVLITEGSADNPQVLFGGEQLDTGITNRTRRTFWSDQGEAGNIVTAAAEDEGGSEDGNGDAN